LRDDFLRFSTKIYCAGNSGTLRSIGRWRGARRFDSDALIRHFIACMRALQNCARRSLQVSFRSERGCRRRPRLSVVPE